MNEADWKVQIENYTNIVSGFFLHRWKREKEYSFQHMVLKRRDTHMQRKKERTKTLTYDFYI